MPAIAGTTAGPADGLWYVLYVKSRQEKALAEDLTTMGIGHFLPLVGEVHYYGPRKCRVVVPLFPGYVFLRGTREQLFQADRTRRVARIIEVINQQKLDWELRNIELAIGRKAALSPFRVLERGWRVEVKAGPFAGLQGVVDDPSRMDRIVLQVRMLGRAVCMEIDGSLLVVLGQSD